MEPRESFDDRKVGSDRTPAVGGDGASVAASVADRAKEATSQAVKEAKESLNRAYERSSDALGQAYHRVMDYSRENPRQVTLVALGAGFGMGLLCAYGMAGRRDDRRFLPAVAATLADAIADVLGRRS